MRFLVTGTAGFIGFHVARRLLADGHAVAGIDGFTPYYDVGLKRKRHELLERSDRFTGYTAMLEDAPRIESIVAESKPEVVLHFAAQAGVRYSLENPRSYVDSNLIGTFNLLQALRRLPPQHMIVGSTSSVYGANTEMPFTENQRTDHPLTLYAATKKAAEEMAHAYSHLYAIPTTIARFFTIYGPWGRPDMALFKFVDAIVHGRPIDVYGHGRPSRDFTYIDDLVQAIVLLVPCIPGPHSESDGDSLSPRAPYRVVNIGCGKPVNLLDFIDAIERELGRKAVRKLLPPQPGDLPDTFASSALLERLTGYRPATPLTDGVRAFVDWYREYFGVKSEPS